MAGCVDGLNVRCEKKRGVDADSEVVAFNNEKGEADS